MPRAAQRRAAERTAAALKAPPLVHDWLDAGAAASPPIFGFGVDRDAAAAKLYVQARAGAPLPPLPATQAMPPVVAQGLAVAGGARARVARRQLRDGAASTPSRLARPARRGRTATARAPSPAPSMGSMARGRSRPRSGRDRRDEVETWPRRASSPARKRERGGARGPRPGRMREREAAGRGDAGARPRGRRRERDGGGAMGRRLRERAGTRCRTCRSTETGETILWRSTARCRRPLRRSRRRALTRGRRRSRRCSTKRRRRSGARRRRRSTRREAAFGPFVGYDGALTARAATATALSLPLAEELLGRWADVESAVLRLEHLDFDARGTMYEAALAPFPLADGHTAHVYASRRGASALRNHTDTTDVLVLQLSGAKEWRHCRAKREAKCATYADAALDDLACETVVLEPGDALFLPRGVVHGAVAVDAAAVHLTIGLGELTERAPPPRHVHAGRRRHGVPRRLLQRIRQVQRLGLQRGLRHGLHDRMGHDDVHHGLQRGLQHLQRVHRVRGVRRRWAGGLRRHLRGLLRLPHTQADAAPDYASPHTRGLPRDVPRLVRRVRVPVPVLLPGRSGRGRPAERRRVDPGRLLCL